MSPLALLPVFLDLRGKRVVVAGDGEGAVWKAELLAAAGACVEVYAADPSADLLALQADPPAGCVLIIARAWQSTDFTGAAVAIGALEGDDAAAFASSARAAGVPVNVVDTPELGSFNFATIVNRAPITIAISTDGAAPVLGQSIRAKIEALLHPALGDWAAAAKTMRSAVKAKLGMGAQRRDMWRGFDGAAHGFGGALPILHSPPNPRPLRPIWTA
jgi:uroporphyrin-III C-methyltransferase / precorrin-2 dehydrogenase / sirohydrochlorin ferrochelatase